MRVPLWGLILAGGKGTRMQQDKGALIYHGQSQRRHCFQLLSEFLPQVFVSCRQDQATTIEADLPTLFDAFGDIGPIGGILSAFDHEPNVAWLVLACDMPLLTDETVMALMRQRDPDCQATAFCHPADGNPEPLAAIWEPASLPMLRSRVSHGRYSPRQLLQELDCRMLTPPEVSALTNVNTPAEHDRTLADLSERPGSL